MITVGFHNFNLRIFNLRVSNPNKLIVDVFLTRCRISMCQGPGPKKHDEISEIDRIKMAAAPAARSSPRGRPAPPRPGDNNRASNNKSNNDNNNDNNDNDCYV